MNIEAGIEISANLPLLDTHYESRRGPRTSQHNSSANIEDLERYENIIDLLDFEDVFEYFDEVESLVEQTVLGSIDLLTNVLKRSLSVVETSLGTEALV